MLKPNIAYVRKILIEEGVLFRLRFAWRVWGWFRAEYFD